VGSVDLRSLVYSGMDLSDRIDRDYGTYGDT